MPSSKRSVWCPQSSQLSCIFTLKMTVIATLVLMLCFCNAYLISVDESVYLYGESCHHCFLLLENVDYRNACYKQRYTQCLDTRVSATCKMQEIVPGKNTHAVIKEINITSGKLTCIFVVLLFAVVMFIQSFPPPLPPPHTHTHTHTYSCFLPARLAQ